jgi:hypothetical protein
MFDHWWLWGGLIAFGAIRFAIAPYVVITLMIVLYGLG